MATEMTAQINQGGAVSTILVPEESVLVPLEDNNEVMLRLLCHNQLHLHQAWDNPFANGPSKEYIKDYGLGSGAQDILDINFDLNVAKNLPVVNF
eukprot:3110164-Ditylum_brightwellii.AAC.1